MLAFIAYSVKGVTDIEMLDLLSLDEEVISAGGINKYHKAEKLPTHLLLRVKSGLYGLITARGQGCTQYFHRQVAEVAADRYKDRKVKTHFQLAEYFNNMVCEHVIVSKGLQRQPILLSGDMFERRDAVINI